MCGGTRVHTRAVTTMAAKLIDPERKRRHLDRSKKLGLRPYVKTDQRTTASDQHDGNDEVDAPPLLPDSSLRFDDTDW